MPKPTPPIAALAAALALALPLAAAGLPARAAEEAPPAAPRFAFVPVEGGALKMDTVTGKVSLCARRPQQGPAGFACEAVPDSRDAYEAEIARLTAELEALRHAPPPPGPPPSAGAPTDAEMDADMDRALDYAERAFRRLKRMIDQMRQEPAGDPT